jgi:hypothetical protein
MALKLHTTASCSFSSCRWRSAAVKGRGCRKGPGPGPTPVLSAIGGPGKDVDAGKLGEGRLDEEEALTALWFEGRMFSDGEPGAGGGGICWEDARRDRAASACGDGGTELRSGMATLWLMAVGGCKSTNTGSGKLEAPKQRSTASNCWNYWARRGGSCDQFKSSGWDQG